MRAVRAVASQHANVRAGMAVECLLQPGRQPLPPLERCERKQLWDRFFRCVAADGPVRRAVTKTTQRVVASKSIGLAGVQESTGGK